MATSQRVADAALSGALPAATAAVAAAVGAVASAGLAADFRLAGAAASLLAVLSLSVGVARRWTGFSFAGLGMSTVLLIVAVAFGTTSALVGGLLLVALLECTAAGLERVPVANSLGAPRSFSLLATGRAPVVALLSLLGALVGLAVDRLTASAAPTAADQAPWLLAAGGLAAAAALWWLTRASTARAIRPGEAPGRRAAPGYRRGLRRRPGGRRPGP